MAFNMKAKRRGQTKETDIHSLKERVAELSELPKDVVMGMPVLTVMGQTELSLENYRGIIEYTDTLIRVQIKGGQIRVTGKRLQVASYTNDEMKVNGYIQSIEYQQ